MDYCVLPLIRYGIVYLVTHSESGMIYVGQTFQKLTKRWSNHKRKVDESKRGISYLARAIARYGEDAFNVEVLDCAQSKEELDHKEKFWIAFLDAKAPNGYNLLAGGGSTGRRDPLSIERGAAKQRGRKLAPDDPRCQKGRPARNKGVPTPESVKQKQSAIHRARYAAGYRSPTLGRKRPPNELKQMSEVRMGKPVPQLYKPVVCVETGQVFESIKHAAQWLLATQGLKTGRACVSRSVSKPHLTTGGYHWIAF